MPVTRPGLASVLLRHLLSTNFTDAPILPRATISEDGLELKQGVILRRAGVLYASIYAMSTFEPLAVRKTGSLNGRVPVFSRVVLLGLHYLQGGSGLSQDWLALALYHGLEGGTGQEGSESSAMGLSCL